MDGDGDNDVITSLAAHTYGLAWFEQTKEGDAISFKKHVIVGDKAEESPYGILFTEPHAVALIDMDGDGLKDIVTGKTYWSHHRQSPMWDAGARGQEKQTQRRSTGCRTSPTANPASVGN